MLTLPSQARSFLSGAIDIPPGTYSGDTGTVELTDATIRVLAGVSLDVRKYIDPADPANDDDPNREQWVWESMVPMVASVTASQSGESYTAYLQKDIVARQVPMFQHTIFIQGQLQLHRSYLVVGPRAHQWHSPLKRP
ncbi:MAG: hypothetical protein J6386_09745 [Candidatus Synoicihabitans palmerolidicus]|nr:hypothetical protein [Candidatus Synoicihabitans palmerolidicus]